MSRSRSWIVRLRSRLRLARDLIELSGYQVGRDIDIAITGLRAGEKLREELFSADEVLAATEHEKILVVSNGAAPSPGQWKAEVEALLSLARAGETEKAGARLRAIVGKKRVYCKKVKIKPLRHGDTEVKMKKDSMTQCLRGENSRFLQYSQK